MRGRLLLLVMVVAGCGARNPYLGRWDSEVVVLGNKISVVHTFSEGGKHQAEFEVAGVKGMVAGTYTFEGDQLTITPQKFTFDASGSFLPKSMIEQGRGEIEKVLKRPQAGTVQWRSDTEFAVQPEAADVATMLFTKKAPK